MGSFYVNYTVRHPDAKAVAAALRGRAAMVTPSQNGNVVVYDEASDDQDQEVIVGLGTSLSKTLQCAVLAVLNNDDDVLWYRLFEKGKLVDHYDSDPGYFDDTSEEDTPTGGDARRLCAAFGNKAVAKVEAILRKSDLDDDGYGAASERHSELVEALGLPLCTVGSGYSAVADGDLPDGMETGELIRVT